MARPTGTPVQSDARDRPATPPVWRRIGRDGGAVAAFLVLYVALDWVSVIEPFGALGITPWNPPAGLIFALFLLRGARALVPVFAAVTLADVLLRGVWATPFSTLASAAVISLGYGWTAMLLRDKVHFSPRLDSRHDVLWLLAAALGATAVIAVTVVWIFCTSALVPWSDFLTVVLRYWTGDVIGIAGLTPFILLLVDGEHRQAAIRRLTATEAGLQLAAICAGLWTIFGLERAQHFEFAYVLFLPLIWIALRHGMIGATWGIVATQLGLIVAIQLRDFDAHIVTQFQLLMLAVTVSGLFLGAVVDERRRVELALREHQAELAHAMRLTTTGEMAAAIAHELNQPLTAVISFVRACQGLLRGPDADREATRGAALDMIDNAVQQATRAGRIIRSTREFLKRDDRRSAKAVLADIIDAAIDLVRAEAAQNGVRIAVRLPEQLPPVLVDPIQVEQVILNLLHNSIEAMVRTASPRREIALSARLASADGFIEIGVRDSGPGFAAEMADRLFTPFSTTKDSGMGLGMAICRSIVEAHGGTIWAVPGSAGAEIRFTLPIYDDDTETA